MGRQQDDGQGRMLAADFIEQGQAVAARQLHVGNDQGRQFHGQARQGRFRAAHGRDPIIARLEADGQQAQQVGIVIDQ
ncbi:hypothetical protein D3C81_1760500 [compost metagenome]